VIASPSSKVYTWADIDCSFDGKPLREYKPIVWIDDPIDRKELTLTYSVGSYECTMTLNMNMIEDCANPELYIWEVYRTLVRQMQAGIDERCMRAIQSQPMRNLLTLAEDGHVW